MCIGRVGEDLREDVGVVVGVVECFTPGAMRCGGQKPEFHGSSFVVASSGHFREDVANMSLKKSGASDVSDEDATKKLALLLWNFCLIKLV